jgi:hypothetical protein
MQAIHHRNSREKIVGSPTTKLFLNTVINTGTASFALSLKGNLIQIVHLVLIKKKKKKDP